MADDSSDRKWVLVALERHERHLTHYALGLTGDEELARDAVQHSFLQLCDAERKDVQDHLAPWLYTVCRNKALDLIRNQRRLSSLGEHGAREAGAPEDDPATLIETKDLSRWVQLLIDELPSGYQEVLDLLLQGFSHSEIATITNRSVGNARVIAHRAITRLREHPRVRELLDLDSDPGKTTDDEPGADTYLHNLKTRDREENTDVTSTH